MCDEALIGEASQTILIPFQHWQRLLAEHPGEEPGRLT